MKGSSRHDDRKKARVVKKRALWGNEVVLAMSTLGRGKEGEVEEEEVVITWVERDEAEVVFPSSLRPGRREERPTFR